MRKLFIAYILCVLSFAAFSQNLKEIYNLAENAMSESDFNKAIYFYNDFLDVDYHNLEVYLKLGHAYRLNQQYDLAEKAYKNSIGNKTVYAESYFWLAEVQSLLGKTKDAKENYSVFIDKSTRSSFEREKAKQVLKKNEKEIPTLSKIVIISDTISPFIHSYGTYSYKNSRVYNGIPLISDSLTGNAQFFFYGDLDSSLQKVLTQKENQITDFAPFPNQNLVMTTLRGKHLIPQQFITQKQGNVWDSLALIEEKTFNSPISIHPQFVSFENKIYMFFSSNKEGGFGGMDIWFSEVVNDKLSEPINAGNKINTTGDELCPFYDSASARLFFSSDWHNSVGGFDVFYCKDFFTADKKIISNVGKPVNSSFNELYFRVNNDTAFFASNRKATSILNEKYYLNKVYFYELQPNNKAPIDENSTLIAQQTKAESNSKTDSAEKHHSDLLFEVFFDNNQPMPEQTNVFYQDMNKEYLVRKEQYILSNNEGQIGIQKHVTDKQTTAFFDTEVAMSLVQLQKTLQILQEVETNVKITLEAYTSNTGSFDINKTIAENRIQSIVNFFNSDKIVAQKIESGQISISKLNSIIPESQDSYTGFEISAAKLRKVKILVSF